ncbi:50S ribosomal protein L21 [Patescibacteria group bacterium]|nr:50S ribosomal protein L21 [Patescibacteria group bacterium]
MITVIKTGGKQYKVKEGDKIKIEKINLKPESKYTFEEVLLLSDEDGSNTEIGNPLLKNVKVEATILDQGKNKKIRVAKYKNKIRYNKIYGHKQPFTEVQIKKISKN